MRSLVKADLNHSEEIYRLLVTMVKKLKMSRKEASVVITETVADVVWLNKLQDKSLKKYAVALMGEEVAKIIFYVEGGFICIHDLYVTPRYRKQKLAKALLIEMFSDYRTIPGVSFYTRESNKPVHNLVQFFAKAYGVTIPTDNPVIEHFYVDGANAVTYKTHNPAFLLNTMETENANDNPADTV